MIYGVENRILKRISTKNLARSSGVHNTQNKVSWHFEAQWRYWEGSAMNGHLTGISEEKFTNCATIDEKFLESRSINDTFDSLL